MAKQKGTWMGDSGSMMYSQGNKQTPRTIHTELQNAGMGSTDVFIQAGATLADFAVWLRAYCAKIGICRECNTGEIIVGGNNDCVIVQWYCNDLSTQGAGTVTLPHRWTHALRDVARALTCFPKHAMLVCPMGKAFGITNPLWEKFYSAACATLTLYGVNVLNAAQLVKELNDASGNVEWHKPKTDAVSKTWIRRVKALMAYLEHSWATKEWIDTVEQYQLIESTPRGQQSGVRRCSSHRPSACMKPATGWCTRSSRLNTPG